MNVHGREGETGRGGRAGPSFIPVSGRDSRA